jgi:long-chain fatty acid transport protein
MKHTALARCVAVALLGLSGAAPAITTVEQNSSIPFSFSNPGARSLGMGGAFVALADDATAAYTNPAGLTGLGLDQQISVELRRTETSAQYATGGAANLGPFDTAGIQYGSAGNETDNLSFLSWVLPREDWAIAIYRHEMLNYENAYTAGSVGIGTDYITNPYRARTDLSVITYGASFAYNLTEQLALGAGLSWHDFEIGTSAERFDAFRGGVDANGALVSVQSQNGDDDDIGFNLGLIFRGSDNFNIGVSYRSAPKFEYQATNRAGPAFFADAFAPGVFTGQLLADQVVDFEAPDMLGIGFSWRPTDNLTVNFDVNKINYSNLSDGIVSPFLNSPDNPLTIVTQVPFVFNGETIPVGTPIPGITTQEGERIAASGISVDDVFEPRLGMEYALTQFENPIFLRAGLWREPRHTLRFDLDPEGLGSDTNLDDANNPRLNGLLNATVFSTGDDELHFSGGLGWAFPSFQIDFAIDVSDRQDVFSASGVWRF